VPLATQIGQRRVVGSLIAGEHDQIGLGSGRLDGNLVELWQFVPLVQVDVDLQNQAWFPPARAVIVVRHLVETQLFVVVGTDPLGGVDRSGLQGLEDLTCGQHLHVDPELGHHLPPGRQCASSTPADRRPC
jgi:hypothetical protein